MSDELILVIDDDRHFLESVREILELEDYHVLIANNGADGIRLAQKKAPALIICDVMMPGVNGYDVLAAIRDHPITQSIPMLFLASKRSQFNLSRGKGLGADDFLVKPFSAEDLLFSVADRLRSRVHLPPSEPPLDIHDVDVRFLAAFPNVMSPGNEYALLGYIFAETAQQDALHDAYEGGAAENPPFVREMAIQANSVTAVPRIPGFTIKPERVTHEFHRAWHRFDFTIFAPYRPRNGVGSIDFYVNGIIAASITLDITVTEEKSDAMRLVVAERFQHVYCSYSHQDKRITEHIETAMQAPNHEFLRDVHDLRQSQEFSDDNLYAIEQADAFQLFW